MSAAAHIKTLLREADLYRQQGLLNEAKARYKRATEVLKNSKALTNSGELIQSIVKKVVSLNQEINKINEAISKPKVSEQKQDLIDQHPEKARELATLLDQIRRQGHSAPRLAKGATEE